MNDKNLPGEQPLMWDHFKAHWLQPIGSRFLLLCGVLVLGFTVLLFSRLGENTAAALGDTFGIAGAILSGMALIGVAASLRQIDDSQKQQEADLKRQQEQINALADIARALTDPIVVARIDLVDNTAYFLTIENTGKMPAYNVRFEVSPKKGLYPFDYSDLNLADMKFIKNGLKVMAPSQKISSYVANGQHLGKIRDEGEEYVNDFTLIVSYCTRSEDTPANSDFSYERSYSYYFNFDTQVGTTQPRGEIAHELYRIKELFEESIGGTGKSKYVRTQNQ